MSKQIPSIHEIRQEIEESKKGLNWVKEQLESNEFTLDPRTAEVFKVFVRIQEDNITIQEMILNSLQLRT